MTVRYLIIIFFLTPFALFGQTVNDSLSNDIYAIIKSVIIKEKINKNHGLVLTPEINCNINQEDTAYLNTLLIKPKPVDTVNKTSSSGFLLAPNLTYPDKNIFTQEDIDYILKTKEKFTHFKWDNSQLGFDLKNKKKYYAFSVPYFNLTHDKAIVMYEFRCGGLCGGGSTLLFSKTDKGWDETLLELWFH